MSYEPIGVTDAWRRAVRAVGGRCQCTGECGKRHKETFRCPAVQGGHLRKYGRVRLCVTDAGAVLCQACFPRPRKPVPAPEPTTPLFDMETES